MHWSIQAAVLTLCIVTCCTAQTRGGRRFSVQEAIAEEDVEVKNHRFQAARHGTRTEIRNGPPASREVLNQARQSSNRQETISAEVVPTRRSYNSKVDNEIVRNTPRFQSRQQVEVPSSTGRQYSARNRPTAEVTARRRNDVITEEAVTRESYKSRNDRIRGSFTSRGIEQPESTTAHSRSRGFTSRGDKEDKTTSQIRSRNSNNRVIGSNQSRTGRGRNLALDESTTQSLRSRGRTFEKVTVNEIKTTSRTDSTTSKIEATTSRFSDSRPSRYNEPTRSARVIGESETRVIGEGALLTRSRGRNAIRGRINPRTEVPSAPPVEVTSAKLIEEVPAVPTSETPLDTFNQQQPIVDALPTLEASVIKPDDIPAAIPEKGAVEVTTRKINDISSEPSVVPSDVGEFAKEVTTAKANLEGSNGRNNFRGRSRSGANARFNEGRSRTNDNSNDYESVTRSSRRNPQRTVSRPDTSTRSTADRSASRGRGRARVEQTRNSRTEVDATTATSFRSRNHLQQTNVVTPVYQTPQIQETNPISSESERKVNDLPTAIGENDRALPVDFEIQANNPTPIVATTARQLVTSQSPVTSILGRKPGRGTARASKTEVISCTCYTKAACNLVDCPQF